MSGYFVKSVACLCVACAMGLAYRGAARAECSRSVGKGYRVTLFSSMTKQAGIAMAETPEGTYLYKVVTNLTSKTHKAWFKYDPDARGNEGERVPAGSARENELEGLLTQGIEACLKPAKEAEAALEKKKDRAVQSQFGGTDPKKRPNSYYGVGNNKLSIPMK